MNGVTEAIWLCRRRREALFYSIYYVIHISKPTRRLILIIKILIDDDE